MAASANAWKRHETGQHGAMPCVALRERRSLRRRTAVREAARQREHGEGGGGVFERGGRDSGSCRGNGIVTLGCKPLRGNGHRFGPNFVELDRAFGVRGSQGFDQRRSTQAKGETGGQQQSKQGRYHEDSIAGSDNGRPTGQPCGAVQASVDSGIVIRMVVICNGKQNLDCTGVRKVRLLRRNGADHVAILRQVAAGHTAQNRSMTRKGHTSAQRRSRL